jgi:hypothetical protein
MDKELQGKLVEILTNIQSGVGEAKDFALSQLPDIAQSYVVYGRVVYVAIAVLSLAGAACSGALVVWAARHPWKGEFGEARGITNILAQVSGGICGLALLFNAAAVLPNLFLVWLAPKVWLLKELAHLVK